MDLNSIKKDRSHKYYEKNKEVIKEKHKKYRDKNKDKLKEDFKINIARERERTKKYRKENPERYREYCRKSYEKNKEKVLLRIKKYKTKNSEKVAQQRKKYCEKNREKIHLYYRNYYKINKEKMRDKASKDWLRRAYNITMEEYKEMLYNQGYKCACCDTTERLNNKRLAVDHDHKMRKEMGGKIDKCQIRGLLCNKCNVLLDIIEKDEHRVEKLIEYLHKFKNKNN